MQNSGVTSPPLNPEPKVNAVKANLPAKSQGGSGFANASTNRRNAKADVFRGAKSQDRKRYGSTANKGAEWFKRNHLFEPAADCVRRLREEHPS